jgi:hypothetical protein
MKESWITKKKIKKWKKSRMKGNKRIKGNSKKNFISIISKQKSNTKK